MEELQNHKRLQHLQGEPRQRRSFGQLLGAPPRFRPRLRPKPQKMFFYEALRTIGITGPQRERKAEKKTK